MSWWDRRDSWTKHDNDPRTHGDIDYGRVVHSASFRRLQGKTQILNLGESDFYRTRLTHSLEVAQIAGGIVSRLASNQIGHAALPHLPDRSLIQAIGCTHDLGHPPFGHGGEVALNYCMRDVDGTSRGGFEGNGQTLRILSKLENFSQDNGANLTRRTLLGVLKYPVVFEKARNPELVPVLSDKTSTLRIINAKASKPPKCYMSSEADVVSWIFEPLSKSDRDLFEASEPKAGKHNKPLHKSLDCSIMDVADDIAYGVHDLEDAIELGLIDETAFRANITLDQAASYIEERKARYPDEADQVHYDTLVKRLFTDAGSRKLGISQLVSHFVSATRFQTHDDFEEPLLKYRAALQAAQRTFLDALQNLVVKKVITSPGVQHLEFKGQNMVVAVFEAFHSDPERLLPADALTAYRTSNGDIRTICDHVASMTDGTLLKTYERLFAPRMGSVFDPL
ncbi:MAG: dGTPase [Rhodobacteraceae bacterium]|nr:dGTPase [Paracoccaceae bacterium]